jgi:hypothetical protein
MQGGKPRTGRIFRVWNREKNQMRLPHDSMETGPDQRRRQLDGIKKRGDLRLYAGEEGSCPAPPLRS